MLKTGIGAPDSYGELCYVGDLVSSYDGSIFVIDEIRITDTDILFVSYGVENIKVFSYIHVYKLD